jgi:glycerophosphoryl diester phosphodiesterase
MTFSLSTLQVWVVVLSVALTFSASSAVGFDSQGHRGARGLMPENTLPGFSAALGIGVDTLEMDVGLTVDNHVVLSHNPRLEPEIVRNANGQWLVESSAPISTMNLKTFKTYDVGRINPDSRYAERFGTQQSVDGTQSPTLADVFELVRRSGNSSVRFNIELKINPNHPEETFLPPAFVSAVLSEIKNHKVEERVIIQSFDWRVLQETQSQMPKIKTAYLTASQKWLNNLQIGEPGKSAWLAGIDIDEFEGSAPRAIKAVGGDIWSPYHKEVSSENIQLAQQLGLSVIVWTVNDMPRMRELIKMGVDGIISDYPDRLRSVMDELDMPLPISTAIAQ